MKMSRLGNFVVSLTSLLTLSSLVYGAADREARITELENQMKQVGTETAMGTYGANTASASPDVDGRGWFITLDPLFWRAKVGGTDYAYTDQDPQAQLPIKGRKKLVDFDWDWGVRIGLGCNLDHDSWDFRLQYTWWNGNGHSSTRAGQSSSIIPMRGSAFITDDGASPGMNSAFVFCTSAKASSDVDYQAIDIELGRAYYMTGMLSFRPFWGVKTAWIDIQQKTSYTGGIPYQDDITFLGLQGNSVHIKERSDFWGLGPRTGLDTTWYLGNGISIFGDLSGAFLWGYFDVDHKEKFSADENARIRLHANRHAFSPMVQFQLGLRYDTYILNDTQHLGIGVGFESQYWWRQNQMLKVRDSSEIRYDRYSEDLTLYGLTFSLKWDF